MISSPELDLGETTLVFIISSSSSGSEPEVNSAPKSISPEEPAGKDPFDPPLYLGKKQ
jgi:hypothetical protein